MTRPDLLRWGGAWLLGLSALAAVLSLGRPQAVRPRLGLPAEQVPIQADAQGRFRIVHAADFPSLGKEPMLRAFVDEMAVVKPVAVLATGDIAYDTSEAWLDFIESQFQRLEAMGIRVILVPGNHERKGWAPWLRRFGSTLDHRVDLGPLTILSLDSAHGRDRMTPSQFQWFRAQLESAKGRTVLVQIHHPIFPPGTAIVGDGDGTGGTLRGYQKAFVELCKTHDVAMVISGHWHADSVWDADGNYRDDRSDFPGPKFVVTTALGDSTRRVTRWPHQYFGYRILEFEGGRLLRYTHDLGGKGGDPVIASTPLGTNLKPEAGR